MTRTLLRVPLHHKYYPKTNFRVAYKWHDKHNACENGLIFMCSLPTEERVLILRLLLFFVNIRAW